jgi:peroxiredoxin
MKKKFISKAVSVWVLCALFMAGTYGTVGAAPQSAALEFTAVSLDGKSVSSSQFLGKAYIVNFFASWCPPCRAEIPDMVALQAKYSSKGFTFIGVGYKDTNSAIRDFTAKMQVNYPVVIADDKLATVFSAYTKGEIRAIPTSFVVDSSGRVTQVITGGLSKEAFEKIIVEALKKSVRPK